LTPKHKQPQMKCCRLITPIMQDDFISTIEIVTIITTTLSSTLIEFRIYHGQKHHIRVFIVAKLENIQSYLIHFMVDIKYNIIRIALLVLE
jgi:hypothetical protein